MSQSKIKAKKLSRKMQLALARKKEIAKQNRAFAKLSPEKKRITIAQDVLAQIALEKFKPEIGLWLADADSSSEEMFSLKDYAEDKELRDVINNTETCTGCALGGLFMCTVKRVDALKVSELSAVKEAKNNSKHYECSVEDTLDSDGKGIEFSDIIRYFAKTKIFSRQQAQLIEIAFEGGSGMFQSESDKDRQAENFFSLKGDGYDDVHEPTDRLRLIMENLIANKGTFDPAKKPQLVTSFVTPGFNKAA